MPDSPTVSYRFIFTEDVLGDVVGRLSSDGAWLDEIKHEAGGEVAVEARLPVGTGSHVERWFKEITGGDGRMVRPPVGKGADGSDS